MDGVLAEVTESYRQAIVETVAHFTGKRIERDSIQDYKNRGGKVAVGSDVGSIYSLWGFMNASKGIVNQGATLVQKCCSENLMVRLLFNGIVHSRVQMTKPCID